MSKVAITGNTSGTGVFTVASPNSNVDRVLTLPDESGTVITTAGVPASAMPAGSVIQTVHFDYNTIQSFTTPANIDDSQATGLTATITPLSTTSKILVLCSANIAFQGNTSVVRAFVQRTGPSTASTTLSTGTANTSWTSVSYQPVSYFMGVNTTMNWLDSPNTTSACTYTLRIGGNATGHVVYLNTHTGYVNAWGGVSHLTLLEVVG